MDMKNDLSLISPGSSSYDDSKFIFLHLPYSWSEISYDFVFAARSRVLFRKFSALTTQIF